MAIELAKAYVQIVPSTEGIEGSLTSAMSGAGEKAGEAGGKGIASGFGKVAGGIGKAATTAIAAAGAAATTAAAGIIKGSSELAEFGDNIDKMSQKMGISAEAYQEWDAVMQHSGTSIDSMSRAFTTLSKNVENGSDAFDKLGLSQEEVAKMSKEDLFGAVIEGLQDMEEGTERTVLAQELLGGAARELGPLLNTSASETQAMKDRVHELGGVLSNEAVKNAAAFQDNLQDLQTSISGMKNSILQQALPGLNQLMQGFTGLITGQEGASEAIGQGFQTLLTDIGSIAEQLASTVSELFPVLMQVIVDNLPSIIETGIGIIMDLATAIIDALPTIIQGICDMLPTIIPQVITAIVDLFLMIVDHLDEILTPITEAFPDIINSLTDALIENLPQIIAGIIMLVVQIIRQLPGILKGIWETITHFFSKVWQEWIGPVFQAVGQWFSNLFQNAWQGVQNVFANVGQFFSGVWQRIQGAFAAVGGWFSQIFQGAWRGIQNAFSAVGSFFSGIWQRIQGAFSTVGGWFGRVFSGVWEAIKRPFKAVGEWFSGVFERIKDVIKAPINWIIRGINKLIEGLNRISFDTPDWIPIIGGRHFGFNIGYINELATGGVLEKGQMGLLEGSGAEAVVPLEKNTGWIRRVAEEMQGEGPDAYMIDTEEIMREIRGIKVYLDGRTVVGGIATGMDQALGNNQIMAGRMVATT